MKFVFFFSLIVSLSSVASSEALVELTKKDGTNTQNTLGTNYQSGEGVLKSNTETHFWLELAEQGNERAQYNLGLLYLKKGNAKKNTEALKWIKKAANQGLADAQAMLGMMFAEGDIIPKNQVEAVKWYKKSAEQGDDVAQHNLGLSYYFGIGVPKNDVEAMKWLRKAAKQGYKESQNSLSFLYWEDGGHKNLIKAYLWASISSAKGEENAKTNLEIYKKQMTKEQIATAQELASKCWESKFKDCD
jgi:TPR repeat protein